MVGDMLVSQSIRAVLGRSLDCGGFVIPHGPAESVAVHELEARRMLVPALHCGAFKLTEAGEAAARAVLAP